MKLKGKFNNTNITREISEIISADEMTGMRDDLEEKLVTMITRWASFMSRHPNYEKRLKTRIRQEDHQENRIKNLGDFLGDLSRKRILDLGCGMGGFAVAMRLDGFDVVPLDFNLDYCQITKLRGQRYGMNLSPVNALGESLPFKGQLFDVACLYDVLEHVQSPEKVLKELCRALKPGGSVFVTVINRRAFRDPHYHLRFVNWMPKRTAEWYINRRKRSKSDIACEDRQKLSEMNYFGFDEFRGVARKAGFDVEDVAFLKINQPCLIRDKRWQKCAEVLKATRLNRLAYICFRLLSRTCASNFEFILHKGSPGT